MKLGELAPEQLTIDGGEGDEGPMFHAKRALDELESKGVEFVDLEHVYLNELRSELWADDAGRKFRILRGVHPMTNEPFWRVDIRFKPSHHVAGV